MNKKTFEELVNDSRLLNKDTLSELEQLLKEYPFCQTFHLLYAKNLHQLKHIRYNQQLKVAAAVTGDRTRLKHFIEGTIYIHKAVNEKIRVQVEPQPELNIETVKDISSVPIPTETIEVISEKVEFIPEKEIVIAEQAVEVQTSIIPEETPVEIIPPQEDEVAESSETAQSVPEYESVIPPTPDAKVSREEKKKAIIALINKKFGDRIKATGDIQPEKIEEETLPVKTEEVKEEMNSDRDVEFVESVKWTPGNAIEIEKDETVDLSPDIEPIEPVYENILEDASLEYLEGFSGTDNTEPIEEPLPEPVLKKEVITSNDLIEKFLRDAPRMPRPKKEFYNPVNLAARSIVENEDFYTETYASICLKQGSIAKAIKIYEKLSLKFPEKSSYFAGLIEKTNKEKNI